MKVQLGDIQKAQKQIAGVAIKTTLASSHSASLFVGAQVYLKYENQQVTGSFKVRGALNKMHSLSKQQHKQQVVASSAGNHAQGLAYSATYVGSRAHIVMPQTASMVKAEATRGYGAEVIHHGHIFDEAYEYAQQLAQEKKYIFVHPFEDEQVMAGQGTVGLEILDQLPDVEAVVVPIGGGGLISGIAVGIKQLRPQCKVYGAVTAQAPDMMNMFHNKPTAEGVSYLSLADGIAVKKPSPTMYKNYISHLVDDIISVDEDEIAQAMVFLLERTKTVVEGSGAVALAAARKAKQNSLWPLDKKCCLLLSGGNVDMSWLGKVIERGLVLHGRIARLRVMVDDRPGALNFLTRIVSEHKANILQIHHDRLSSGVGMQKTSISFLLETRNQQHLKQLTSSLKSKGVWIM